LRCSITIALQFGIEWNTSTLVYADDVNIMGENMNTVRKNKEALLQTCKEVGLEVNTEKTKYVVMSHHHNSGHNHSLLEC
jgi:hypothetical protein